MLIDCHVHGPVLIPGKVKWLVPECSGLKISQLEKALARREKATKKMHGVFYGGNDPRLLPEKPQDEYLLKRILPMIEQHKIQLIGVTSWDNLSPLYDLMKANDQIEGIEIMAEAGGLAIIDQPRIIYERDENTNSVFLNHKGEATIYELLDLSEKTKKRTFLCYDGMLPPVYITPFKAFHRKAEDLFKLTGLKLFGGSDTIIRESSLFSSYSLVDTEDIRTILENPKLVGVHKSILPLYKFERYQRLLAGGIEEYIMGLEKREEIHKEMVRAYLEENNLT